MSPVTGRLGLGILRFRGIHGFSLPNLHLRFIRSSTTGAIKHLDKLIIECPEDAMDIAARLTPQEQSMLRNALDHVAASNKVNGEPMSGEQQKALFLVNALPFVGFGCLDNMIMIFAGEYIDVKLGTVFCISTMAAAALGNLISDVAGVGLAHYVEVLVSKIGIKHPVLTLQQLESPKARWTTNCARAIGLSIGCVIGMFPLLLHDKEEKKDPSS